MAHSIEETVYQTDYTSDGPPKDLAKFIEWAQAHMAAIPESCRASAKIRIDSETSWGDDHHPVVEITYRRPVTEAEYHEHLAAKREAIAKWQRELLASVYSSFKG